jgi:hypothetical protein
MRGPYPVEIERDGKTISGTYTVEGSGNNAMVRVSYGGDSRATQAGASGEEATAKRLLFELTADFRRPAR